MKRLSCRILVFLALVLVFLESQVLIYPNIERENDAALPSLRHGLNVAKETATQLQIPDSSSTSKSIQAETLATRNADESDTSVRLPISHPLGSPSALSTDFPADDPPIKLSESPSIPPRALYPSQIPSIQRDSASVRRDEASLPMSENRSTPNPETPTKGILAGDKARTFSLARANLKSTNHPQDTSAVPLTTLKNDFPQKCAKWGVVTTISDPTEAIVRMSKLPEWCLVVVADTKTPANYMEKLATLLGGVEKSTVYFFSMELQKKWELLEGPVGAFAKAVPWNHLVGRKNMGYLFAVLHGAEFVFDFDEHNYIKLDQNTGEPLNILPSNSTLENVTVAMVGLTAFNVYPMMMEPSSISDWSPRGFPLEHITNKATEGQRAFEQDTMPFVSKSSVIGVIQFLADLKPDFEPSGHKATHVLVPKHAYSPYYSEASIHTQPALWATLLPITVSDGASDIWRSYFAQCIFADSNLRLVFAPPKIERRFQQDGNNFKEEESHQYQKSGQLIEFLSHWDSDYLTVPERVEQLWMDLYEHSYIELEDVVLLQKWLEVLLAIDYQFPELQPRFRNVAVMGQFNYANFPNIMAQAVFWTQKTRERFQTTVVAGPFDESQMALLKSHGIEAMSSEKKLLEADDYREMKKNGTIFGFSDDFREINGFFTPLSNLMRTLVKYHNCSTIEAVLYVHDDALLNITELSEGKYPFPTDKIIANRKGTEATNREYVNLRFIQNREEANRLSHRVYPNGTITNVDKTIFASTTRELKKKIPKFHDRWEHVHTSFCGIGQQRMTMDPEFAKYLDADGTAWFGMHTQSDFLMVPTKYTGEFARAASLHLKYRIWIECAFGKVIDILEQKSGAKVRLVRVCTKFMKLREKWHTMKSCLRYENAVAIFHPWKMRENFASYSEQTDAMNHPFEEKKKNRKKKRKWNTAAVGPS